MFMMKNGLLENMDSTCRTETLIELLDRVVGESLAPDPALVRTVGATSVVAAPVPTVGGSPTSGGTTSRGIKRSRPLVDGDHAMSIKVDATKRQKKGSFAEYTVKLKGTCRVCKSKGDKKKSYPQTSTYCSRCKGFVHGRNTTGYPACWDQHLTTTVDGLCHSGEMLGHVD